MANYVFTELEIKADNAAEISNTINSWCHPLDARSSDDDEWLGGIYANAGVTSEKELADNFCRYNTDGSMLYADKINDNTVCVDIDSAWTTSLEAWVDICEMQFPDAKLTYRAAYETGERYTNDTSLEGKFHVEAEGCSNKALQIAILDTIHDTECINANRDDVIRMGKATGKLVKSLDDAIDALLDYDVFVHPWTIENIHNMD